MLYELRVYHCAPGRMPALLNRFANTTLGMWAKHSIRQVGFWTTEIGDSNHALYYLLEWESLAEREKLWNAFQADQDWIKARADSEKDGPILARVENHILKPTAFSKMK